MNHNQYDIRTIRVIKLNFTLDINQINKIKTNIIFIIEIKYATIT